MNNQTHIVSNPLCGHFNRASYGCENCFMSNEEIAREAQVGYVPTELPTGEVEIDDFEEDDFERDLRAGKVG